MLRNGRLVAALLVCAASALPALADGLRNGLPPVSMDSFVTEAKEYKEFIYGDEGVFDIPPYFGFEKVNRIGAGIFDRRDQGLTTNHGSWLPDAWGKDEFLGQEWDRSGPSGKTASAGLAYGVPDTRSPTATQPQPPGRTPQTPYQDPEFTVPGNYRNLPRDFGRSRDAGRRDTRGQRAASNSSAPQGGPTGPVASPGQGQPFSVSAADSGSGF